MKSSIEKLVKVLEFQNERRVTEVQSEWSAKPVSVRVDPLNIYLLDRLASYFGMTRGGLARDLLDCAIQDAYGEAFGDDEHVQVGPDEYDVRKVWTVPTKEQIDAHMEKQFGNGTELNHEEAPFSLSGSEG